jgi:excinuclease UvrABC nuclease subunit
MYNIDQAIMAIEIGEYTFEGPFTSEKQLENRSGVYAILCLRDSKYSVIDVGESAAVRSRVESHDRKDCWRRHCAGTLMFAVYYTPNLQQTGRMDIEQKIRRRYDPPCGKE